MSAPAQAPGRSRAAPDQLLQAAAARGSEPSASACELYVYYRVAAEHARAVDAAVARFQTQLEAAHPGLSARRLCRPAALEVHAGERTFMEVYRTTGGASIDPGAVEAAAALLAPWLRGARHLEVFEPCAS